MQRCACSGSRARASAARAAGCVGGARRRPRPDAALRLQRLADAGFDDAVVVYRGGAPPDLAAIRALLP